MQRQDIRNIVIIAHVDHGKTTLVDCLLRESGEFRDEQLTDERMLDSNDLERERGITILAKNISLPYKGVKINVIDTPGHADFGGEVERVLQMADAALVLVDAAEGPMPQTRFVLSKAIENGVKPLIVVNKIDRPDARIDEVVDETLELLMDLGCEDVLDDFPIIYASAKEGYATHDPNERTDSILPIMELILEHAPGPDVEINAPLRMIVTTLEWSEYVGRIAVGRIAAGSITTGQRIALMQDKGKVEICPVKQLQVFENLGRTNTATAEAGDIVALIGLDQVEIGDTVSDTETQFAFPRLTVDAPTLEMTFSVNTSPFVGKEGKYVTNRQLRERLDRELEKNVALRVEPTAEGDAFAVAGRGVLHLSVLIETMRREGFELSIGKPRVVLSEIDGTLCEPYETLTVEVPSEYLGPVMELVGGRRGEMQEMTTRGEYSIVRFVIPSRGLIGLRTKALNSTHGSAIMHHRFTDYRPADAILPDRSNGVLVSQTTAKAVAFGLDGLQQRAELFISPGDEIYEGMVVGENSRSGDMTVNPTKEKKLTNMRASGSDDNIVLQPPRLLSLEEALEYIADDELVEVTPKNVRLRKKLLHEADRRRAGRQAKG
jgi:GTP-binding protein